MDVVEVRDACYEELHMAMDAHQTPFHSHHEGHSVILEELDELWEHVKANRSDSLEAYEEAMQVAAMALAYMIEVAP